MDGKDSTVNTAHIFTAVKKASAEALFVLDTSGRILDANGAAAASLNAGSAQALAGSDIFTLCPDFERSRGEYLRTAMQKNKAVQFEDELFGRKYINHGVPFSHGDGSVAGIVLSSQDVTSLRRADEKYRRERQRYYYVLESLPGFAFLLNRDYSIRYANRQYRSLFGSHRGKCCYEVIFDKSGPCADCPVELGMQATRIAGKEWLNPHSGREYLVYTHPMSDEDGALLFLVMGLDVTEQNRAQRELRKAKEQAEAANEAKTEFLANISHEIRTPLNGVLGMLQLLRETPLDQEQEDCVGAALQSGRGLLAILNDLLSLCHMETGDVTIQREVLSLRTIVDSIVSALRPQASLKGIELAGEVGEDVPAILLGDEGRIRQVLFNVVGNAVKFTHKGGVRIHVNTLPVRPSPERIPILITVTDTGEGFPDSESARLFEPFTQADGSSTRMHGGIGLGLGIVKRLVSLMHGNISVDSQAGRGTTFYFSVHLEESGSEPV